MKHVNTYLFKIVAWKKNGLFLPLSKVIVCTWCQMARYFFCIITPLALLQSLCLFRLLLGLATPTFLSALQDVRVDKHCKRPTG